MTAPQLSALAALLADPTRACFCDALLDGRAWTAGELARHARVAPSTASEHIARLVDGGLVTVERQGRHRYVRLADPRIAQLIEDMSSFAAPGPPRPRSLRAVTADEHMAAARTCYDHLAGSLGVRMTDAMTAAGHLDQAAGFAITATGRAWLTDAVGLDLAALDARRRPLARPCLDWTERRPHLGGAVGAAICARFFAEGWIERTAMRRAVRVTPSGQVAIKALYGLDVGVARPVRSAA